MLAFFKKLMFSRQINNDNGNLTILDIPVFIVSVRTVSGLQEIITQQMGDKGVQHIYAAGKKAGRVFAEEHRHRLGVKGRKLYELIENLVEMGGWGDIKLVRMDYKKGEASFQFNNSPFPTYYKKSKEPVCHLIRGLVSGACEIIFEKNVDCVESSCRSMGKAVCRFDVLPSEKVDRKSDKVKKQVPVAV